MLQFTLRCLSPFLSSHATLISNNPNMYLIYCHADFGIVLHSDWTNQYNLKYSNRTTLTLSEVNRKHGDGCDMQQRSPESEWGHCGYMVPALTTRPPGQHKFHYFDLKCVKNVLIFKKCNFSIKWTLTSKEKLMTQKGCATWAALLTSTCAFLYMLSPQSHPVTNLHCKLESNYSHFQLLHYYGLSDLCVRVCVSVSAWRIKVRPQSDPNNVW